MHATCDEDEEQIELRVSDYRQEGGFEGLRATNYPLDSARSVILARRIGPAAPGRSLRTAGSRRGCRRRVRAARGEPPGAGTAGRQLQDADDRARPWRVGRLRPPAPAAPDGSADTPGDAVARRGPALDQAGNRGCAA